MDTLAYLKVVLRPLQECVSIQRVINVPPRHFGEKSLQRLAQFGALEGLPLWSILKLMALQAKAPDEISRTFDPDPRLEMDTSARNLNHLNIAGRAANSARQFYAVLHGMRQILLDATSSGHHLTTITTTTNITTIYHHHHHH